MAAQSGASSGGSPFVLAFFIFMTLKLCGVIDWSWWWVTAPIWGVFLIVFTWTLALLWLRRGR